MPDEIVMLMSQPQAVEDPNHGHQHRTQKVKDKACQVTTVMWNLRTECRVTNLAFCFHHQNYSSSP